MPADNSIVLLRILLQILKTVGISIFIEKLWKSTRSKSEELIFFS